MRKSIIITAICFIITFSDILAQNDQIFSSDGKFFTNVEQRSILVGKIENLSKLKNLPLTIKLDVHDLSVNSSHSFVTYIHDDGSFLFDIPLYHSVNASLNFCNRSVDIYLRTMDSLNVFIEINEIVDVIFNEPYRYFTIDSIYYDKKHAFFQHLFKMSNSWINDQQIPLFYTHTSTDLNPYAKKDLYLNFEKQILADIDDIAPYDSSRPNAMLLKDHMVYSAVCRLNMYIIRFGLEVEDKAERMKFYEYLTDEFVYNTNAFATSYFQYFLDMYRSNVKCLRGENPDFNAFDSKRDTTEQLIIENIEKSTNVIFNQKKDIWQEYIAASNIYSCLREKSLGITALSHIKQLISKEFTDKYLQQLLTGYCLEEEKRIQVADTISIPENAILLNNPLINGNQLLSEIIDANKGNVLYIVFLDALINSTESGIQKIKKLQEKYRDKAVKFIFLSGSISEEDQWEKAIRTHQIEGTHYLLSKEQTRISYMRRYLIPSQILVSKSGKINDANLSELCDLELCNIIDKLLLDIE